MIIKKKIIKNNRSLKVSEIIRKAISNILIKNDMPIDPPFTFPVNVVKVDMNSDLRIAYIFVCSHEEIEKDELIEKLNTCRYFLSKEISKAISLKFLPKLVFKYDNSFESLNNLEKIFQSKKVMNDTTNID
tara:strand:+ start:418 stop:810 length:393 start_codon:yes stop_codon:yes gene_type:complete